MILIVDKSQKTASTISDIFYHMGILCGTTTPERAHNEISNRYSAIIFSAPEKMGSIDGIIKNIREYSLGAPVFALSNDIEYINSLSTSESRCFDKVFSSFGDAFNIANEIIGYLFERDKNLIGSYRLAGIDASIYNKASIEYFDEPLQMTKTEIMIIRYLIKCYPTPCKAQDILRFAFKTGKTPEITSIRTHVSAINKTFRAMTGRNMIHSTPRVGYTILTPCNSESLCGEKQMQVQKTF